MSYEQLIFEMHGHTALLKLNRPESFNAFSNVMRNELRDALGRIAENGQVRAVIITGEGRSFCGGGDVKLMVSRMEKNLPYEERREIFRRDVGAMVRTFHDIKVPLIAAVNGGAYGAGVSLALLCDIRIASPDAKFGFLFGKRGLIPDWGANYFLPRIVGYAKAMELVTAGKIIGSQAALVCGLVNQIAEEGALLDCAMELAASIASNSPYAVRESKTALRFGLAQTLPDALEYEAMAQSQCQISADHKEGVRAFVEKREPKFN